MWKSRKSTRKITAVTWVRRTFIKKFSQDDMLKLWFQSDECVFMRLTISIITNNKDLQRILIEADELHDLCLTYL